MTIELTAASTYSIGTESSPSTLTDDAGVAIDLTAADVEYVLTTRPGDGEIVKTITNADPEWTAVDAAAGEFAIEIDASEVPQGTHYEEFRVTMDGTSIVALVDGEPQREVIFRKVATSP